MAELRPYTPTWRDTVASWMMGQGQSSPERRAFVGGLLGSTGLGNTGVGVVDATPVGGLLSLQEASQAGDKTGMALASAGLIPGAGIAEKVAAKVAERSAPAAEKFITAYHGSPHSFDKFSLDKIGTGEGAQVYGHGLYFADNEGVAKSYRDALGGDPVGEVDRLIGRLKNEHASGTALNGDEVLYATKGLEGLTPLQNSSDFKALALDAVMNNNEASIAKLKELSSQHGKKGSMYQVKINADPEHFLDWDKPLSEQSSIVQEAVRPHLSAGSNPSGQSIYEAISNKSGAADWPITADAATRQQYRQQGSISTTNALRDAGIPGIKYLDQGSRNASDVNDLRGTVSMLTGAVNRNPSDKYLWSQLEQAEKELKQAENSLSRNYVVFDDSLIDILKKYGLVGLLGGGAAMGASQQQQQGVPSL